MTTALVTSKNLPALPEKAVLPRYSRAISEGLWLATAGLSPTDAARQEAGHLLAEAAPMMAFAKPSQISNWLARINFGVSTPLLPQDFDMRASMIADALSGYQAAVFTSQTAREAMTRFKWFPGVQEIVEFLDGPVKRLRGFERDLTMVRDFVAPVLPRRPEPTEDEKRAVSEIVRGITKGYHGTARDPTRSVEEQLKILRG